MNPKTQQRLEALLATFDAGAIQPEELMRAVDAVMLVIENTQKTILGKVDTNDKATEKKIKEMETAVDKALTKLAQYSDRLDGDKASKADVEKMRVQIGKELNRIASLIPTIPDEFDATDIYNTIESHKSLLENLSVLIVGENIRNALEALPDGEKLAIDAIEGLREELAKRVEAARSATAIIAQNLYQINDVDLTGLANGDTIIWNSTTNRWEAGSGGGGASAFTDLTDAPSSYTGQAGKVVAVKGAEDGLEFITVGGTGTVTSVAVSGSDGIEVDSGSPVTTNGTIALGINAATLRSHINVADGATAYTNENAQDAVGTILTDTTSIDLIYDDAGNTISAQREALSGAIIASKNSNTTALGSFTLAQLNTAVSDADVASGGGTATGSNSGDVTLTGTPDYITISGQVITRNQIDLTTDITGDLPFANLTQLSAHQVLGRAGTGTGDVAGITMGNDTILGRAGSGDVDDLSASQVRTILNVADGANVYTDEQAQDAVGAMAANSTFVSLTYNDGTPSLTPALSATGTPSATTFLRGDNTWATPAGGGGGITEAEAKVIARRYAIAL